MTTCFKGCTLLLVLLTVFPLMADEKPSEEKRADERLQEWNQWRGPTRDGKFSGPAWPKKLDETHLKQLWRVELGPGYSGPIVTSDRIFVTETVDRKMEVVRALDRKTGRELWKHSWEGSLRVPFFAMANGSWIRSTPAYDGKFLYVAGIRDVLVCLHAESGEEQWRVDFVKEVGSELPAFGFVASPLVVGEFVYVQAGASFAKLNKQTGKIIWQSLKDGGGTYGSAFSSPVLHTLGGKEQFIVQTRTALAGVDPETGKELWSQKIPAFRGMNILTPTFSGEKLFTSSYGGGSFLFDFEKVEKGLQVNEVWKNKVQAYMSSPVIIDGHIYVHLRNQRFACIDLETGKDKWISKPYGKYWSMIAQDGRILALDQKGQLLLINANPNEFELLDSRTVSEDSTWAHLAMSGRELFIRELKAITAWQWDAPQQ